MTDHACSICGAREGREWTAREMMFGLRDPFVYFECGDCGCLQLVDVPPDLSPYYPSTYYSLGTKPTPPDGVKGWLRERRNEFAFSGSGLLGKLLNAAAPYPISGGAEWFCSTGVADDARILDVGCGTGTLVYDLAVAGYPEPIGVDPFIESDLAYEAGATVLKRRVTEVTGTFDLIIFNHSLEHIADQIATLRAAADLLADGGVCVVRMPTVSSYAWRHYRSDWVQLDAPRHLVIHSVDSLSRAANRAGLHLNEVRYDSNEFQFLGSELYRRDIPLFPALNDATRGEIRRYRRRARELNAENDGDQASFFLTRS